MLVGHVGGDVESKSIGNIHFGLSGDVTISFGGIGNDYKRIGGGERGHNIGGLCGAHIFEFGSKQDGFVVIGHSIIITTGIVDY